MRADSTEQIDIKCKTQVIETYRLEDKEYAQNESRDKDNNK